MKEILNLIEWNVEVCRLTVEVRFLYIRSVNNIQILFIYCEYVFSKVNQIGRIIEVIKAIPSLLSTIDNN